MFSKRISLLCGAVVCLLNLSACGDKAPTDNTTMLPNDGRVSTIPWNKPQDWEQNSQLGPLAQDPRIGGSR